MTSYWNNRKETESPSVGYDLKETTHGYLKYEEDNKIEMHQEYRDKENDVRHVTRGRMPIKDIDCEYKKHRLYGRDTKQICSTERNRH